MDRQLEMNMRGCLSLLFFIQPFLLDLLAILLDSCPTCGAPSHVSYANACYFCDLEFIAPIFALAQGQLLSDTSLPAFLWQDFPSARGRYITSSYCSRSWVLLPFPPSICNHYMSLTLSFLPGQ